MDSTQSSLDPHIHPVDVPFTDHERKQDDTDRTVLQYNWRSDRSLVPMIVDAVAANSGEQAIMDAPPLHNAIDPDALDSLFAPTRNGGYRDEGVLSFEWANHCITVDASGLTTVESLEEATDER